MTNNWKANDKRIKINEAQRQRVLKRDKHLCRVVFDDDCQGKATEVDHILTVSNGGTNDDTNLRASCKTCNAKRNIATRGRAAWHIPTQRNPGIIQ